jgi:hypothetical protein
MGKLHTAISRGSVAIVAAMIGLIAAILAKGG